MQIDGQQRLSNLSYDEQLGADFHLPGRRLQVAPASLRTPPGGALRRAPSHDHPADRPPRAPRRVFWAFALALPLLAIFGCTSHCSDRVKDGDEVGVDCGGSCAGCPGGNSCRSARDCASGICSSSGYCAYVAGQTPSNADAAADLSLEQTPSPLDAAADPDAADAADAVDLIANGTFCGYSAQCQSGCCSRGHVCSAFTCCNGVLDGDEEVADCGGSCGDALGTCRCAANADCPTGCCEFALLSVCGPTHCCDHVLDADEVCTDSGGSCGDKLGPVYCSCQANGDCATGCCARVNYCVALHCCNGVRDADESDVDCGGASCAPCTLGKLCGHASDCDQSGGSPMVCTNGRCACVHEAMGMCVCGPDTCPPELYCDGQYCLSPA